MERALRTIATSLTLLATVAAASAQGDSGEPEAPGAEAACEAAAQGTAALDEAQQAQCRSLWQKRVEAARQRSQAEMQRVLEERRQRLEREASQPPPPPSPPTVTVDSFTGGDDLAYGDVVVTDKGPRVFIGKGGEPPGAEDFVALDSPLSPVRGNVRQYDGAFPGQQRPHSAKPRPAPRRPQERQP